MRFAVVRLPGGAIGGILFDGFGFVRIFGDILLKAAICKIDTAVFDILNIGNLTIISGSVKGSPTAGLYAGTAPIWRWPRQALFLIYRGTFPGFSPPVIF